MRTAKTDQTGRMSRLIWVFAGRIFCWFCHAAAQIKLCIQAYQGKRYPILNQRTIGPESLTWVLRIYELEQTWKYMSTQSCISCHPYRSLREQIWPCHKNGQSQPRVIIWTKTQGMGIQPLGTSSSSIFNLLLFLSCCTNSRKISFVSLFYMIFCFIT